MGSAITAVRDLCKAVVRMRLYISRSRVYHSPLEPRRGKSNRILQECRGLVLQAALPCSSVFSYRTLTVQLENLRQAVSVRAATKSHLRLLYVAVCWAGGSF